MFKYLLYAFFFFIAMLLQTVIAPRIEILGAQPSFLLILTVITALRHGTLAGCFMGFISGLLCDVYAPVDWFGTFSLSYCVVGFVVGHIYESFINLSLLLQIVVLILADFLKNTIYYFSIGITTENIPNIISSLALPDTVYTVILGAICFYLLSRKTTRKIEIYK